MSLSLFSLLGIPAKKQGLVLFGFWQALWSSSTGISASFAGWPDWTSIDPFSNVRRYCMPVSIPLFFCSNPGPELYTLEESRKLVIWLTACLGDPGDVSNFCNRVQQINVSKIYIPILTSFPLADLTKDMHPVPKLGSFSIRCMGKQSSLVSPESQDLHSDSGMPTAERFWEFSEMDEW